MIFVVKLDVIRIFFANCNVWHEVLLLTLKIGCRLLHLDAPLPEESHSQKSTSVSHRLNYKDESQPTPGSRPIDGVAYHAISRTRCTVGIKSVPAAAFGTKASTPMALLAAIDSGES